MFSIDSGLGFHVKLYLLIYITTATTYARRRLFWLNWKPSTIIKRIRKSTKRPLIQGLNDQEIEKIMLDRNKHYAKSNFKIDCDNHKKNEIVDKIVSILKENEIKS